MKKISLLLLLILPFCTMAQSNKNHIKHTSYQVKTTDGIHKAGTAIDLLPEDRIETTSYFDGLGRAVQTVNQRAGGDNQDIVTHIEYDEFDRQIKTFLPYASTPNGGLFRTGALNSTQGFYDTPKYENTLNPFSEKILEASPDPRNLEQAAPGNDWKKTITANSCFDSSSSEYSTGTCADYRNSVYANVPSGYGGCYDPNYYGYSTSACADIRASYPLPELPTAHTIKFEYGTNTNYDFVRQFGVDFSGSSPQLIDEGYYPASQLYKIITRDENWSLAQTNFMEHTTEEYKDKQGRVVLKRTFDQNKWLDTYYVYDDYGNLTYVLPPKAVTLNNVSNPYKYDLGFYGDISDILLTGGGVAEYAIWDTDDGFSVAIEAVGFTEGTALKSGKIAELDFSPYAPPLMDVVMGNIVSKDSNGNIEIAATLYVQDGDLYLDSTGAGLYTPDGNGDYFETFYADISNYIPNTIDSSILDGLCYQYQYDDKNRLVEKRIPGKDAEYIVYNKLDQPVLTQDYKLRLQEKWMFTKYDAFGRVAYTGIFDSNLEREDLQDDLDAETALFEGDGSASIDGMNTHYTNNAFPRNGIDALYTINYYDDYDFYGTSLPSTSNSQDIVNHDNQDKQKTKGLATGSKVRVLGEPDWVTTVTGYDKKGRAIYVKNINDYLGTTDVVESKLDFTGKTEKAIAQHIKSGTTVTTTDDYYYDHMGRLLAQKQKINSLPEELIVLNEYDELGQLVGKKVGGGAATNIESSVGLQTVDYSYNIRGWLKQINDPTLLGKDLFSFKMNYNTPVHHSPKPLYNGNIAETEWRTANTDNGLKWYSYNYDALNRLKYAINNDFNFVEIILYDKNGNITSIQRKGLNENNGTYGYIDNLSYDYYEDSNQLKSVSDNASSTNGIKDFGFVDGVNLSTEYVYDGNGNMIKDFNKGIEGANGANGIQYNHLNLPDEVRFGSTEKIEYIYDATGTKLSKKVVEDGKPNKYTFYAGSFVYDRVGDSGNGSLKFFNHPEGYVDAESGFKYVYQYKDHLGNVRLSYSDSDGDGEVKGDSSPVFTDDLENTSGWDSVGALYGSSATVDNTRALSGNSSAKLHLAASGTKYAHSNLWFTINNTQPTEYIFSGWVYVEATGDHSNSWARLVFFMNEDSETSYFTEVSHTPELYTKNQWVYVEKKVTVPANIDEINLRIGICGWGSTNPVVTGWFDNLSIRKVNDPGDVEIVEENNYYPFGLEHKGYNKDNITSTNIALKRKFGGKEYQDELGLDSYDFGARNYQPELGRWFNIDPYAEMMRNQSPYNFGFNNPIYFSDLEGNIPWPVPEMFKIWKRRIDSYFGGPRTCKGCSKYHKGLDINFGSGSDDVGAPVYATHSGKVTYVNTDINSSGGRFIEITSFNGTVKTRYLHLSSVAIKQGDEINEGRTIGLIGGSANGSETGRTPHLHYELHIDGKATSPIDSNGNMIDPQLFSYPSPPSIPKYSSDSTLNTLNWLGFQIDMNIWFGEVAAIDSETAERTKRAAESSVGTLTPSGLSPLPSILPSGGTITPAPITPVTPPPLPPINCKNCKRPKG